MYQTASYHVTFLHKIINISDLFYQRGTRKMQRSESCFEGTTNCFDLVEHDEIRDYNKKIELRRKEKWVSDDFSGIYVKNDECCTCDLKRDMCFADSFLSLFLMIMEAFPLITWPRVSDIVKCLLSWELKLGLSISFHEI